VGIQDGKKGIGSGFCFRHFFASMEMRLGGLPGCVKCDFGRLFRCTYGCFFA
jgi:hypothetical protein